MPLQFLDFDCAEDAEGLRSWSALAAPVARHAPALEAEVQSLLDDLGTHLGPPGPIDEGHDWDLALDSQYADGRTTVSLHLTGQEALADRLAQWLQE